jgi:hypothetical protein
MLKVKNNLSKIEFKVTNKFLSKEIPKTLKINSNFVNSLFTLKPNGISKFRSKK